MTFFKLIFLAAVLFLITNVRVAPGPGHALNHVFHHSHQQGGFNQQTADNRGSILEAPGFRDVVINEIMADPNPPNKLPDAEFIEILNTSNNIIDLTGWTFSDPKSTAIIPGLKIKPGELIILCKNGQQALFSDFGVAIGLTGWPALNNAGDELILKTADSVTIDIVSYSADWYLDDDKSKGGWSLEQINPFHPCPGSRNWQASENPAGGSPGMPNAVFEINPDLTGPEVVSVLVENTRQVIMWFNEKIDAGTINVENLDIEPANDIESLEYEQPFTQSISIHFKNALQSNTLHTLAIDNVTDCAGNLIRKQKNSFQFALAVPADSMDVVINEVLFNPRPGGKDFVELYNASQNYIDLKDWRISNNLSTAENPKVALINRNVVMKPSQYLVITEEIAILRADYPFGKEENYYEVQSMPTLPDDYGNITLTDSLGKIIDAFDYSESYHLSLIRDPNGVSLERISVVNPANSRDNWHSAASAAGYATPGYENSQKLSTALVNDQILIEPKVFIPNNDGVKDFAGIHYEFDKGGYLINIWVYDIKGRRIKEIVNNGLPGVKGFYQWNGTDRTNKLVPPGYYVVLLDILDPEGVSYQIKKTVVVALDF